MADDVADRPEPVAGDASARRSRSCGPTGSRPTVVEPEVVEVRRAAGGDEQLVGGELLVRRRATVNRPSSYETREIVTPVSTWMPSRPNTSATTARRPPAPPGRGCRSADLEHGDLHAEPGARPGPARPRSAPPPMTTSDAGQLVGAEDVAVGPVRRVGEPVDRRGRRRGAGVEDDSRRRARRSRRPPRPCRGPASRPWPRTNRAPASSSRFDRDGVVPVVGGLVADPGVHRRPVGATSALPASVGDASRLGERVGGADDHLAGDAAEVGALATDQPLVDPDHVEAGLRQLAVAAASPPGPSPITTTSHWFVAMAAVKHWASTVVTIVVTDGVARGGPEAEAGLGCDRGERARGRCRARCRRAR